MRRMVTLLFVGVLVVAVAVPAGARRVWETDTCAGAFGTDYEWTTGEQAEDYGVPLTLTRDEGTACIDLITGGGDFTVTFAPSDDANVTAFYASVRDSIPGSHCGTVESTETGGVVTVTISDVPASENDGCSEISPDHYPDFNPELALWVGVSFKGKPVGSVDVAIAYGG